tara:strand:- start:67 stop:1245 length:1179 start_codon:yes stop_codon:yes gene_type:complete
MYKFIICIITITLLVLIIQKIFKILFKKRSPEQKLLENPKDYFYGKEKIDKISSDENLVKIIDKFMIDNNLYENGVIVSLSGGVDSMVILAILIKLQYQKFFQIVTCNINYNLRKESEMESTFLKKYCGNYNINSNTQHLNGTFSKGNHRGLITNLGISKRSKFEELSKNVRYNSYKKLANDTGCCGVMLGHHCDDIIENIFTNSMRGHNLLDIEVMKKISEIRGINIFRPLLDVRKKEIIQFAHKYDIPYFLDTTPKWSRRGKMRNEIFPLFTKIFGNSWKNKFKEIGTQSNNWNSTVQNLIIDPWFEEVKFCDKSFQVPIKYLDDENLWLYALPKLFFKINHNSIKKKNILKLINLLKDGNDNNSLMILDSGFRCFRRENNLIFYNNESD